MDDQELRTLLAQEPDVLLDRLESDIWAGVAAQRRARRTAAQATAWEAALLVVAVFASAAAGAAMATHAQAESHPSMLAVGTNLAPSTLLLGHDQ
jgi:hypothetical protein